MSGRHQLVALGASHHTAPVAIRERLAVAAERMADFYGRLRAVPGVHEALVLNTCNRLEIYGVVSGQGAAGSLEAAVCDFQALPAAEFARHRFALHNVEAVRHLMEVAAGIDSQIVGETEIFGQVKSAYAEATGRAAVGPVLNRVFQKCFQAAKFIRSNTPIGEGRVSVATVAVDLAEKIFGRLDDCRLLVIGTGEVGEKTVRAMHGRGARRITVLSRARERAESLAASVGASAGSLEGLASALPAHDIVVGSTATATPVVTTAMVHGVMRGRKLRPLFLIDLGLPRNIDAAVAAIDSVFLYDLDDLARIADENLTTRRTAVERCRHIARDKAARIWEGVLPRLETTAAARPGAAGLEAPERAHG